MEFEKIIREMVYSSIEASKIIKDIYARDFEVTYKTDASPLTAADLASNRAIISRLLRAFPDYAVLSEEEEDGKDRLSNKNGVFIIDPLDGTKEFVNRSGEFCVSIALAVNHRVIAGAIAVPMRNEIYYAFLGKGAYKTEFESITDDFKFGIGKKLRVSSRTNNLVVALSRSSNDERTELLLKTNQGKIARTITVGSCLKGCMIAEGLIDAYYRFGSGTKEWDTAGMQIICEEAGAQFTDIFGKPLCANREDPRNSDGFIILNNPESTLDTSGII